MGAENISENLRLSADGVLRCAVMVGCIVPAGGILGGRFEGVVKVGEVLDERGAPGRAAELRHNIG
jgi:hypothetical protein